LLSYTLHTLWHTLRFRLIVQQHCIDKIEQPFWYKWQKCTIIITEYKFLWFRVCLVFYLLIMKDITIRTKTDKFYKGWKYILGVHSTMHWTQLCLSEWLPNQALYILALVSVNNDVSLLKKPDDVSDDLNQVQESSAHCSAIYDQKYVFGFQWYRQSWLWCWSFGRPMATLVRTNDDKF